METDPISVLLVDDNECDAVLTQRLLIRHVPRIFTVDWAGTYREGLKRLTTQTYDVGLIDLRLDEQDGLELMRAAMRAGCLTPMIILTGGGDANIEIVALQAGAADYLTKDQLDAGLLERVIRHAIERQHVHAALREERQRLKTLIDNLPDLIYFKDKSSRFILCNASQLALLGVTTQEQAVGRTDADFFPLELASQYYRDEQHMVEDGQPLINKEETTIGTSGQTHWILTSKVPLRGPDGAVTGIVGLGRDITALKEAELELRRARDELEVRVKERTIELSEAITALQTEITHRQLAEEQLRETEEQYRTIFEQALDSIMVVDVLTGAFLDFNDHACRQLGYDRTEFGRLTMPDIDILEPLEAFTAHSRRILNEGPEVFETQHRTKNGIFRNVIVSCRPIALKGKKVLLAIFHDITERKRMEDELREAVVRLEKHNKAKSEFVTNVSHELKTPLTSMMYGTRNLLKGIAGPLPEKAVRYLKMFDTECQRLVGTINDILDLGKLDNQALTLSAVTTPLGRLIARSVDPLRLQAEAAHLDVEVSIAPGAAFVKCDPAMIQRVIQNLLSNALKFTPPPGCIRVRAEPASDGSRMVMISVTDSGIGIAPDAIEHLAERYFRAASQASGSGLGLAISKEILLLHGGSLFVESPPPGQDHGTRVSFGIPMAAAPTLLVVDDDPSMQALFKCQLVAHGYSVETVARGDVALKRIETDPPDVVIMDLVLEDMNGGDVILTLKQSPTFRYMPILAVTGATLDETAAEVLTRFAIPTLPKPWKNEDLIDMVEGALLGRTAFKTFTREGIA